MVVPRQKPNRSKQDFETPDDFLESVVARWGALDVDLACHARNCKAPVGVIYPGTNTLTIPWGMQFVDKNCWLNPEFGDIEPYAKKCEEEGPLMRRGRIFLLTPASIGSNWWDAHVHGKAMVLGLRPRIRFVGAAQGYPKDLALSIFAPGMSGYGTWRWKGIDR